MNPQSAFDARTLAELIAIQSRTNGDAVALHWAGKTMTFRELDQRANQVAQALLRSGSRRPVAVLGRDTGESLVILFGATKAMRPLALLNWRLAAPELEVILADAGVSHLFVEGGSGGVLQELRARGALEGVECVSFGSLGGLALTLNVWSRDSPRSAPDVMPSEDDVAALLYTSGTTGTPKGVALAHRGFLAIRRALERERASEAWWNLSGNDVALHTLPLFHIGGLWWAMNMLAAGAPLVVMPQFDPEVALELIETYRVTATCLVPAMLQLVLARQSVLRRNVRSLRTIAYGGAPIAEDLLRATKAAFACNLMQFYGLTETGNTAVCLRASDHLDLGARAAAAGRPYPGVRVRCVSRDGRDCAPRESGEIWIHSPANMLGYWNRREETARVLCEGWVRTGDAGYLDEDGYLYVCDRIKDMIISAGENIYPAEIERALAGHPAVREVAVIGVPDERWGEAVKAFVVKQGDLEAIELFRFLRGKIADFKFPRSVEFVTSLPRTPSGKVKKHELKAPYWEGRARQVN